MKTTHWLGCWQLGFVGLLTSVWLSSFMDKALPQSTPSNIQADDTLETESSQVLQNFQGQRREVITGGATRGINLFHSFKFPSSIRSRVGQNAQGDAGDIRISTNIFESSSNNAPSYVVALISATLGNGNGGNIFLEASDRVSLSNSIIDSGVGENANGKGGNIFLTTKNLELFNGGNLRADTIGNGQAGNIEVKAADTVNISGSNLFDGIPSGIFTFTNAKSDGGSIAVNTNNFRLTDGAVLDSRTLGDGNGGDIIVNAANVDILNGGNIIASTFENGKSGNVTVNATKQVTLSGSGIYVFSAGSGITGDIKINSPNISLDNEAALNAESASGNGGNINLNSNLLLLRRGAQITTNAGTAQQGGDGGNININSKFIIAIPQENSDITANAFKGRGGNVQINSQGIFGIEARSQQTEKSDITASSNLGVAGVISLIAPDTNSIQNSLAELSQNPIDTQALIANSCIARSDKVEGTFTITGSGGLPYRPGDASISSYPTGDVRNVQTENTSRPWQKGDPIVEPTGVYQLPNGQLVMSRECQNN